MMSIKKRDKSDYEILIITANYGLNIGNDYINLAAENLIKSIHSTNTIIKKVEFLEENDSGVIMLPSILTNIMRGFYFKIYVVSGSIGLNFIRLFKSIKAVNNITLIDFGFYDYSEQEIKEITSVLNKNWFFLTRDHNAYEILHNRGFKCFDGLELAFTIVDEDYLLQKPRLNKFLEFEISTRFILGLPIVHLESDEHAGYSIVNIDPITMRNKIISSYIVKVLRSKGNITYWISNSFLNNAKYLIYISSTNDRIQFIAGSSLLISNRLHNIVIAINHSVPFVFYSRDGKFSDGRHAFMNRIGLELEPNKLYHGADLAKLRIKINEINTETIKFLKSVNDDFQPVRN